MTHTACKRMASTCRLSRHDVPCSQDTSDSTQESSLVACELHAMYGFQTGTRARPHARASVSLRQQQIHDAAPAAERYCGGLQGLWLVRRLSDAMGLQRRTNIYISCGPVTSRCSQLQIFVHWYALFLNRVAAHTTSDQSGMQDLYSSVHALVRSTDAMSSGGAGGSAPAPRHAEDASSMSPHSAFASCTRFNAMSMKPVSRMHLGRSGAFNESRGKERYEAASASQRARS